MTKTEAIRRLRRSHWKSLERLLRRAFQEGFEAGLARARGQGRRGRTIREDATVEGLIRTIESHFGLERYAFQVRVVHPGSGRRVPARDPLGKHRVED